MDVVTIFYQAEGLAAADLIEVEREATLSSVRDTLIAKHALAPEVLLFVEDAEGPVDGARLVREIESVSGTKIHAHRCREVDVSVSYNGVTVKHRYAPGTTIARITRCAAIDDFHLSEEDAAEHVLQVKGSSVQPAPGTHVGALVRHPDCTIAFDLVPKVRVQGTS